jgi:hypothetical protein
MEGDSAGRTLWLSTLTFKFKFKFGPKPGPGSYQGSRSRYRLRPRLSLRIRLRLGLELGLGSDSAQARARTRAQARARTRAQARARGLTLTLVVKGTLRLAATAPQDRYTRSVAGLPGRRDGGGRGCRRTAASVSQRALIHELGPSTSFRIDQHIVVSPTLLQDQRSDGVGAHPVCL